MPAAEPFVGCFVFVGAGLPQQAEDFHMTFHRRRNQRCAPPVVCHMDTSVSVPASSSKRTIATWPLTNATSKGVCTWSAALSLLAPASSSKRTISTWPLSDATIKGVCPSLAALSSLAPASSSKRATPNDRSQKPQSEACSRRSVCQVFVSTRLKQQVNEP